MGDPAGSNATTNLAFRVTGQAPPPRQGGDTIGGKKLILEKIMIVVAYNVRVYFVGCSLPFSVCHEQGLLLLTTTPEANF
jgi:hypothetical protein